MNIQVVSDASGRIISLSSYGDTGPAPSGIAGAGVILERGQRLHTLEVPTELEARPLVELMDLLRVEQRGSTARLVAVVRSAGGTAAGKRTGARKRAEPRSGAATSARGARKRAG